MCKKLTFDDLCRGNDAGGVVGDGGEQGRWRRKWVAGGGREEEKGGGFERGSWSGGACSDANGVRGEEGEAAQGFDGD